MGWKNCDGWIAIYRKSIMIAYIYQQYRVRVQTRCRTVIIKFTTILLYVMLMQFNELSKSIMLLV